MRLDYGSNSILKIIVVGSEFSAKYIDTVGALSRVLADAYTLNDLTQEEIETIKTLISRQNKTIMGDKLSTPLEGIVGSFDELLGSLDEAAFVQEQQLIALLEKIEKQGVESVHAGTNREFFVSPELERLRKKQAEAADKKRATSGDSMKS